VLTSYNELIVGKLVRLLFALILTFSAARSDIRRITVNAPIHPITSEYVVRAIRDAERANASLILLGLNTPGGLDTSIREIIEAIVNAKVPVAAYVSPSGARAASAGFFIGIACDVFAMSPGTSSGAAHPVGISIIGSSMDKTMEEKVTNDAASYIRALAAKRGRSAAMAEDAVRKSLSYTEQEALQGGLIDFVAKDDLELVGLLDGKTLKRFDGGTTILSLKGLAIVDQPMTLRQKFLLTISNPNLAYILLMIGLLGLYFEFANPGSILPGVLGGLSLLLAVFAFQILPINYVGLLLILLAVAFFILEVKVHSYGALSVGGVAAMVIGSMMLIDSPVPEMRPSLRLIIPMAVGISFVCIFLVALVIKAHARRALTGREGMIGEKGTAMTDLAPVGKVFVHGELWEAEADETVRKGETVAVVEVGKTLKIRVKKEAP
jgi:membrane-bound serine protease (ClpP class)